MPHDNPEKTENDTVVYIYLEEGKEFTVIED